MSSTKENDELWKQYCKTRNPEFKKQLIVKYVSLVKYVAGRVNIYLGQNVELDDLVGYGIFGLIDAIDKFDLSKGVKFETYASLRIRGSIIDSIRERDWVPRSLRQKQKELEKAYGELETRLGREATDEEMSKHLNITLDQLYQLLGQTNIASLLSLDEYLEQNSESDFTYTNNLNIEQPEKEFEKKQMKEIIKSIITELSEKENKVISLYYFEELTLKEISKIMGVSESRISQLHSKALFRLKSKLSKHKNFISHS